MKAKILTQEAPGGKRQRLADVLPLDTPFVLQIFPIYACNFKCNYCHMSLPIEKRGFVTDTNVMPYENYVKYINGAKKFQSKIKTLRFVGMGEPLLHKDISRMIDYAKRIDVAERVEIITNASLLTPEVSDALISSGLDRMVISLQGVSEINYKSISHYAINFDDFVENIRYFAEKKERTHLYVKVVDIALKGEEEEKKYFDIFGNIADSMAIEKAVPIFPGAQANDELMSRAEYTQFGVKVERCDICSQPFYTMQINPDGKVVGCHSIPYPAILGDCNTDSVADIWNGEKFTDFRKKMLDGRGSMCEICAECNIMNFRLFSEDNITSAVSRLKELY